MKFLDYVALAAIVGSIAGVVMLTLGLVDLRKRSRKR